ncbi:outer membrane beta-barrel protein [Sphingobacterium faecium]
MSKYTLRFLSVITILFLLLTKSVWAQGRHHTFIAIDSVSLKKIDSVEIRYIKNSNLISYSKGAFSIRHDDRFLGSLLFDASGYSSLLMSEEKINNLLSHNLDTLEIKLSTNGKRIGEVIVNAVQNPISMEFGKIIYDLSKDRSKNLAEAISRMPFITVDINRKVLLNGSSNFLVLVDDRPSFIKGTNISEIIRSYPKENLKSVEIITDIPPKYNDQNYSGIINFITNKNIVDGHNTSFELTYGRILSSFSGASTLKSGNIILTATLNADNDKSPRAEEKNIYESSITNFIQKSFENRKINTFAPDIDLTYKIDSATLLTARAGFSLSKGKRESFIEINEKEEYYSKREETNHTQNYSLSYFKNKSKNKPTFDASYQHRYYKTELALNNDFDTKGMSRNNLILNENTFQFDIIQPLRKIKIDYGVKANFRKNREEIMDIQSMNFVQNIFGIYNSYVYIKGKFGARTGGRLEQTVSKFERMNNMGKQNYFSLLPFISLQQILKNKQSLTATYSQRIQRPAIWQLTAFNDNYNPNTIYVGNQNLAPVKMNTISTRYTNLLKGSFISTFEYTFANNTIQRTVTFVNDTVTMYGFENLGKTSEIKTLLNINRPIYKSLSVNFNGTMAYKTLDGYVDEFIKNSGFQGFVSSYLIYRISDKASTSMNFGYYSPEIYLQGKSNSMNYYGFAYNRSLFNDLVNINASILNPFRKYSIRKSSYINGNSSRIVERQINFRSFQIGASLNINRLKERVKTASNSIKNDDINTSDSKRQ